jgi:hypothetical protein
MTSQQGARQAPTARPYYVGELIQTVHAGDVWSKKRGVR